MTDATFTIPAITIHIRDFNGTPTECVNARELHSAMRVGRDFSSWIKDRIHKYGFERLADYISISQSGEIAPNPNDDGFSPERGKTSDPGFLPKRAKTPNTGGRPTTDYYVTLDMAKELAMLERSDLGRAARQYFIAADKQGRADRVELEQLRKRLGSDAPLSDKQAKHLRGLINRQALAHTGDDQKAVFKRLYGRIKSQFDVLTYTEIPQRRYHEALAWLLQSLIDNKPEPTPATPALPAPIEPAAPLTDLQALQLRELAGAISQRHPAERQNSVRLALYKRLRELEGVRSYPQLSQRYFARALALLQAEGAGQVVEPVASVQPSPAPAVEPVPESAAPAPVLARATVPAKLHRLVQANMNLAHALPVVLASIPQGPLAVSAEHIAQLQLQTAGELLDITADLD